MFLKLIKRGLVFVVVGQAVAVRTFGGWKFGLDLDWKLKLRVRELRTRMACYAKLKEDLKCLENLFTQNHDVFQINSATVDDLTCTFIPSPDNKIVIHANITVSSIVEVTVYEFVHCYLTRYC